MKWRVSSSAAPSNRLPFVGSSLAAARTAPKPQGCPTAKYSSRPSGKGNAATARAAAARSGSSTLAGFVRIDLERVGDDGLCAVRPARATRSTSWRQRTAASWRSLGRLVQHGQQAIVEAHRNSVSFGRTVPLLYAACTIALRRQRLTIPKRDRLHRCQERKGAGSPAPSLASLHGRSGMLADVDQPEFRDFGTRPVDRIERGGRAGLVARAGKRHAEVKIGDVGVDAGLGHRCA